MKYAIQILLFASLFLSLFWVACDDDPKITIVEEQFTLDENR